MSRITNVEHKGGFRLALEFSDGTSGIADLTNLIETTPGPIESLRDPKMFATAHVDAFAGTVCWMNGIDIAPDTLYALAHGMKRPESFQETQEQAREVTLRELRAMSNLTQVEVARELGVTQPELSRLEGRREDFKVSTIRKFVRALGWDLELVAVRGSRRLTLRGF